MRIVSSLEEGIPYSEIEAVVATLGNEHRDAPDYFFERKDRSSWSRGSTDTG
jgi:hypothetical protein